MENKAYEELTIRDHFMFGKIFEDQTNSRIMLNALFNDDMVLKSAKIEERIAEAYKGKFVRLDLLAEDEIGRIYDAEIENYTNSKRNKELPRRSRYYQSMMDTNVPLKGKSYLSMPEIFIVFICTYDPFKLGLPQYSFKTKCLEEDISTFDDGVNKIFFNTTADLSVLPKRTQNMLKYIESGETSDEDTEYIDSQVTEARTKEIWREEYMRTFVHDNDVYMDGYDTGYNSGTNEGTERTTVEFYLSSDITKQAAMKKLNYSEDEFDEVVAKYQNELVKN